MIEALKKRWAYLREGAPGERFQRYYRHRQQHRSSGALRLLLLGGGILLIMIGIVLMPAPGPGTLIVAVGAALLAGESAKVARFLDRAERWGRTQLRKWRRPR